jgi:hypothetical protein
MITAPAVGIALDYDQVVLVNIESDNPALIADIESVIGSGPRGKLIFVA